MKSTKELERDVIEAALAWADNERRLVAKNRLRMACNKLKSRRQIQATPPRPKRDP